MQYNRVATLQLMHVVIFDLLRLFIVWTLISSMDCKRLYESQVPIDNDTNHSIKPLSLILYKHMHFSHSNVHCLITIIHMMQT